MPYWWIVTRSFRIAWSHQYLWLLAIFSGESSGGFNFNYSQRTSSGRRSGTSPTPSQVQEQISTWVVQHEALIVTAGAVLLVLTIALFLLAAACEGALVRASAEHDAEREFRLAWAWQAGRMTFWAIVRFRLLLFALALPALLVLIGLVAAFVFAVIRQNAAVAVLLALLSVLFLLVAFVYFIYLGFLDRLGTRALVLEQLVARASIVRAHRLLFKRIGRVLLVWLLSVGVGIALGIVAGIGLAVLAIPSFIAGFVLFTGGSGAWWIVVILDLLVLIPVAFVVAGFVGAQGSTYWTLAFRRLDIDQA